MADDNLTSYYINQVLRDVRDQVDKETAKRFEFWARNATRNLAKKRGLSDMHDRVGQQAREMALSAYKQSGLGQRPSYRQDDLGRYKRYANGRMEAALSDTSIVSTDEKGIKFINKSKMDKYARQWYRLNFGAAPRGSKTPNVQPIEIFGIKSKRGISLAGYGTSEAFRIPIGFWSGTFASKTAGAKLIRPNGIGRDAFYVKRKDARAAASPFGTVEKYGARKRSPENKDRPNRGIQGVRYLDAGTSFLNRAYARELEDLIFYWLKTDRKNK